MQMTAIDNIADDELANLGFRIESIDPTNPWFFVLGYAVVNSTAEEEEGLAIQASNAQEAVDIFVKAQLDYRGLKAVSESQCDVYVSSILESSSPPRSSIYSNDYGRFNPADSEQWFAAYQYMKPGETGYEIPHPVVFSARSEKQVMDEMHVYFDSTNEGEPVELDTWLQYDQKPRDYFDAYEDPLHVYSSSFGHIALQLTPKPASDT